MKKELIKKSNKKWKSKQKWIKSITINLETGKEKYKYFIPKTLQEEKRLEAGFNEKMMSTLDIIFQNEISERVHNLVSFKKEKYSEQYVGVK